MAISEIRAPRALVVDDDEALVRIHARALTNRGYFVEVARDGVAAVDALTGNRFDVILSDINMPEMDGIELLRHVRRHDLDVPVVLVTGDPSIQSAIDAVAEGAVRYLTKPVKLESLVGTIDDAVRFHRLATAKRQALAMSGGVGRFVGDLAGLSTTFGRALESMFIAYQPIAACSTQKIFAYEALLRSNEPILPHPEAILDAAERLGRVHELGRRIRQKAIEPLALLGEDVSLFLNLHPSDLLDEELFNADSPLSLVAHRVVLEVTERASLHQTPNVRERVAQLKRLGFRIAIDDLGAGYSGLTSFTLLEPDVVKLDMSLIRDLDSDTTKQTLVRTMVSMCRELGMCVTAKGIETPAERDAVIQAGCDLVQGYLLSKPGAAFPSVAF